MACGKNAASQIDALCRTSWLSVVRQQKRSFFALQTVVLDAVDDCSTGTSVP
jgi:hypothetical protein